MKKISIAILLIAMGSTALADKVDYFNSLIAAKKAAVEHVTAKAQEVLGQDPVFKISVANVNRSEITIVVSARKSKLLVENKISLQLCLAKVTVNRKTGTASSIPDSMICDIIDDISESY